MRLEHTAVLLVLLGALASLGVTQEVTTIRPGAQSNINKNGTRLLLEGSNVMTSGFIPLKVGLPLAEPSPIPSAPAAPTSAKPTEASPPVVTSPSTPKDSANGKFQAPRSAPIPQPAAKPAPPAGAPISTGSPAAPVGWALPPPQMQMTSPNIPSQPRNPNPQSYVVPQQAPPLAYAPQMPPAYGAPAKEQKMPVYQKPKKPTIQPTAPVYGAPSVSPTYMAAPILSSYPAPAPSYAPPPAPAYAPPKSPKYAPVKTPAYAPPPASAYAPPSAPPKRQPAYPAPPGVSYSYEEQEEEEGGVKSKLWGLVNKAMGWFKKDELGVTDDDAIGYYKDGVWDLFIPLLVVGVLLPILFGLGAATTPVLVPQWVRALANYLNIAFPIKVKATARGFETTMTSETELNELESIFHKYKKAIYSDDCISKIACELGDSFKDYSMKSWMIWIVDHVIPAKFSRAKVAFRKTAQGDWTLKSCSLYKCNTKKLKNL